MRLDTHITARYIVAMPDQSPAITIFRKSPRARTIGVNRDGQPIGTATLIRGGTKNGQWSAVAYCKPVPYSWHLGVFATPEAVADALVAAGAETPDYLAVA